MKIITEIVHKIHRSTPFGNNVGEYDEEENHLQHLGYMIKGDISRISLISFINNTPKLIKVPAMTAPMYKSNNMSNFLLSKGLVVARITGSANRGSLILKSLNAYSKSEVYINPIA